MKSQKLFPITERLTDGIYELDFNYNHFKELYGIMKKYHFALKEAEKELAENNLESNSFIIFPVEKREPLDFGDYIGCGKFPFFNFKISTAKYHSALVCAENILIENNI